MRLIVASFPRSGTHFLMESLNRVFGFGPKFYNLDGPEMKLGPEELVHKTHRTPVWFEPGWRKQAKVLYITRNPLDVFTSLHFYHQRHPTHGWAVTEHPRDMPWADPLGEATFTYAPTYVRAWVEHVLQWRQASPDVWVTYEELNQHFGETMRTIAARLGLEVMKYPGPPPLCGVEPRLGVVGDGANYFSPEEREKVYLEILDTMRLSKV